MSCDSRFQAARIRVDNVTLLRKCPPATISAAHFILFSSEISAVLNDFPVLRWYSTTSICACLSPTNDYSGVSATESVMLIDALLSGTHASNAELDFCATSLALCFHRCFGSAFFTLMLYLAANCTKSASCGFFFFSVLQRLAGDKRLYEEDEDLKELLCRCDTALQKHEEPLLTQRWLDASIFLRKWRIAKTQREQAGKGFWIGAESPVISRPRIERRLCLLPFYAKDANFLNHNDQADGGGQDCRAYLQWNASLEVSLNFLMVMYIVRPEFTYQCLWKVNAVQAVKCAILTEFGTLNVQQPSVPIHLPIAKCIFLTNISDECQEAFTFRPLPKVLLSVLDRTNVASGATLGLKSMQLSTVVNLYLGALIEPTSATTATIADLRTLVKSLFVAAVHSEGQLTNVLSENLTSIPARFVQDAIEGMLTYSNASHTTHLMMFKIIQKLVSCFANVREAFLEILQSFNCHLSRIYKGIFNTFPLDKKKISDGGLVEESRIDALITLLAAICDTAVYVFERSRDNEKLHRKQGVFRQIECHFTWLLVKFSRSPKFSLLAESWKQLLDCNHGLGLSKGPITALSASSRNGTSTVFACRCGAVRILGFSQRHARGILTCKCSCAEPVWSIPALPEIWQWISWEMHYESCIALPQQSDVCADAIPDDYPVWTAWAQSLQSNSLERLSSVQNEVVKSIFQVLCSETVNTGSDPRPVRIPRVVDAVLRSITRTSCFSSISWLYSTLKAVVDSTSGKGKQSLPSHSLHNNTLRFLLKQCIELFLAALPRRHLFPICSVDSIPWQELQNAEWGVDFLFSGRHECEELVTDFPNIACHTGHLGNVATYLYPNHDSLPRLSILCTYVNAYELAAVKGREIDGTTSAKERIISTFFNFSDRNSDDTDE